MKLNIYSMPIITALTHSPVQQEHRTLLSEFFKYLFNTG